MFTQTRSGVANITKPFANDKVMAQSHLTSRDKGLLEWRRGRRRFLFMVMAVHLAFAQSTLALAVPVTIAWDIPLNRNESYVLEVALDPGFSTVVLTAAVRGTAYMWQAPHEGVYHWRLVRPTSGAPRVEASTFVSGSFVAMDGKLDRDQAPRLGWKKVEGADRYKLYMLDETGHEKTLVTTTETLILPVDHLTYTIEVIPLSDGHRTFRDYHFNPSLKLDSGVSPAKAAPANLVAAAAEVRGPETAHNPMPTLVTEPTTKAELSRRHQVVAFGVGESERLRLQKLDVDLDAAARAYGGGLAFWTNPAAGLLVSAAADYHDYPRKSLKPQSQYGNETPELRASRLTSTFAVGYNLLDLFAVKRVLLGVSAAGALAQLPLLPTHSIAGNTRPPVFKPDQISLAGGELALGYLGENMAATLAGGIFTDQKKLSKLRYGRLLVDIYPYSHLALEIGLFLRESQASRCATNVQDCAVWGRAITTSSEKGITLGLGGALF